MRPARTLNCVGCVEAVRCCKPRCFVAAQPVSGLRLKGAAQGVCVAREEDGEVAEVGRLRFDARAVRQRQHERIVRAEHFRQTFVQARHDPALAKIVVDDELPAGLEMSAHVRERLAREQVTLKPYVAVAAVQHQRIHERIDDHVILALGGAQKIAAIVQMYFDARVLIGLVRMVRPTETIDDRIDLDRVHMTCAPLQGATHIVARASADDEHVGVGRAACVAVQEMRQRVSRKVLGARHHLLVIDQVDGERQVWALEVYAVIGRPELLRLALACEPVMSWCESRQSHHERQRCERR